jgi:quercetin dioxygenase-like cupin family protein
MQTAGTKPQPGTRVEWLNTHYELLVTADASGGRIGMMVSLCPPDAGPPRHIHRAEDETFYVLQGEVVFWLEGATANRTAGGTMFIPRGREHTFHVVGPQPARLLTIVTPGGFEGFFPAVAGKDLHIPRDMPAIAELAAAFNLEFTGPPLRG